MPANRMSARSRRWWRYLHDNASFYACKAKQKNLRLKLLHLFGELRRLHARQLIRLLHWHHLALELLSDAALLSLKKAIPSTSTQRKTTNSHRRITLARLAHFCREEDQLRLVLLQSLDVEIEMLLREIAATLVDSDTDRTRELRADAGFLHTLSRYFDQSSQ